MDGEADSSWLTDRSEFKVQSSEFKVAFGEPRPSRAKSRDGSLQQRERAQRTRHAKRAETCRAHSADAFHE